ncbi:uncharacterized protein LOC107885003 isoform X3 [Acyrthosiphon pisum]|nr:uncharacterized protein LOC107885003 isoform X3 [Acyrthosiphon pisum]XP_016663766.1 uncharacterized protein LOC107885003 isoform X3 [Acyrthosiphon pisum]|eukprot:XP_016663765.1 PREDICTED: uncharacterized protein LOC107885003 isoform X3 [Acyrthosiphon pisum]
MMYYFVTRKLVEQRVTHIILKRIIMLTHLSLKPVFVCIFNSILDYCCCIKTLDLINIQFTMQNLQETPISNSCEPEKFKYEKWSYTEIFDKIQKFRKHKVFCDIKLATEEGNIIFGHKAVLASASPYLHAVFLLQHDKDTVVIGQY